MTIDLESVPGFRQDQNYDIVYLQAQGPHEVHWFSRKMRTTPGVAVPAGLMMNVETWLVTPGGEWYCALSLAGDRAGWRVLLDAWCKLKEVKIAAIEGSELVIGDSERVELRNCRLVSTDGKQIPPKNAGPGEFGVSLLTLEQIQRGLDEYFLPLVPMIGDGYRLLDGGVSATACAECEGILGLTFPPAFRDAIQAFDFSNLTLGPISFSRPDSNYLQGLIYSNSENGFGFGWWGRGGQRPAGVVWIAASDPYSFLLDTATGIVKALDPELNYQSAAHIASDFDAFLRGVGTALLMRESVTDRRAFAQGLREAVGGADLDFWQQLVH